MLSISVADFSLILVGRAICEMKLLGEFFIESDFIPAFCMYLMRCRSKSPGVIQGLFSDVILSSRVFRKYLLKLYCFYLHFLFHILFYLHFFHIYIYIYIYVCVCVLYMLCVLYICNIYVYIYIIYISIYVIYVYIYLKKRCLDITKVSCYLQSSGILLYSALKITKIYVKTMCQIIHQIIK